MSLAPFLLLRSSHLSFLLLSLLGVSARRLRSDGIRYSRIINKQINIYVCVYISVRVGLWICVCMCVCACVCVCLCVTSLFG